MRGRDAGSVGVRKKSPVGCVSPHWSLREACVSGRECEDQHAGRPELIHQYVLTGISGGYVRRLGASLAAEMRVEPLVGVHHLALGR